MTTVFASMQISFAQIDTGLGGGIGGAVINGTQGGFVNADGIGTGNVDLNFNGNAHVNWGSLNINNGESLNFNAQNGVNGITVLNTVNGDMSRIYGTITANDGIGQLIISNPNGVLFNGATFDAAGDVMITSQPMTATFMPDGAMNVSNLTPTAQLGVVQIQDSNFSVGGEFNILAPYIEIAAGTTQATNGMKLVTANGQDYLSINDAYGESKVPGVRLVAVDIDGDIYIEAPTGSVRTVNGGTIDGNVSIKANGDVGLNYKDNGQKLTINGNLTSETSGQKSFVRNADINGNLAMSSSGGFVDVGNIYVKGNADLKTTGQNDIHDNKYNHFVHVIGDSKVDGNLNIDSSQNIHIGGYDYDAQKLAEGNLTVGGDLTAHAHNGHVMTTIDTTANKISLKSDNLNVLTDGNATLTANQYDFSANGYIGGLTSTDEMSVDEKIVNIMENYIPIPDSVGTPSYINIAGGEVTNISNPEGASAYIASKGDMTLTGANAGNIYLTSYGNDINITGENVHANNITVGGETDKLKVDYPSRDYTLKYTNIRDNREVTIKGDEEITYELTNGENGYNKGNQIKGENTYLVGPDKEVEPTPEPDPEPLPDPDDNENIKVLRSYERPASPVAAQPYTPIAYAAELDDDQENPGVRKNVDGSVTVVRAFPMVD